jgi:hypothetical protein
MSKDYRDSQLFSLREMERLSQDSIQEKLILWQRSSGRTQIQCAYTLKSILYGVAYGMEDEQAVHHCTLREFSRMEAQQLLDLVKAANVQSLRSVLKKWNGQSD